MREGAAGCPQNWDLAACPAHPANKLMIKYGTEKTNVRDPDPHVLGLLDPYPFLKNVLSGLK